MFCVCVRLHLVVLFLFGCFVFNFVFLWGFSFLSRKKTKRRTQQPSPPQKKAKKDAKKLAQVKNLSKVESNTCPILLRNISGQIFDSKNGNCSVFFLFYFSEKSHSPCRKKNIFEIKQERKKKRTNWTDF